MRSLVARDDPSAVDELERLGSELDGRLRDGDRDPDTCLALVHASIVLAAKPHVDEPEDWLNLAAEAAACFGHPETRAWTAWQAAIVLRDRGRLGRARAWLEGALQDFASAERTRPWLHIDLGALARYRGDWETARLCFDAAESALIIDPGDPYGHEDALTALTGERAQLWISLGLPDQARALVLREKERAFASGDPGLWQASILHEANLLLKLDDFEGLLAHIAAASERTLSEAVRGQLDVRAGAAYFELARRDPKHLAAARAALARARSAAGLWEPEALSLELVLADLELLEGRPEEAAAHAAAARARLERWDTDAYRDQAREHAVLATIEARCALARGEPPARLERALATLSRAYADFLASWADAPDRDGGLGYLRFGSRFELLGELVHMILQVEGDPERALEEWLRAQSLGTLVRRWTRTDSRPIRLSDVRASIAPGAGLVMHLPGVQRSYVFWIDARETLVAATAPNDDLQRLRADWLGAIQQPPAGASSMADATRAAGEELREMLLPSAIAAQIDAAPRVTFVGTELLGEMPFEALPARAGGTLGEHKAIDYWPSMPIGYLLARRAASAAPPARGLALVVASEPMEGARAAYDGLVSLPWTAELERSWTAPYERSSVYVGERASLPALRELEAEAYGVLHIVAHGVYDTLRERPAGLALGGADGSGLVWCSDVEALALPPVVALSACAAARGPARPGDDAVHHLGGAFMSAGARVVLISAARLDFDASAELMRSFHEELAAGRAPAEALRLARRELARDPARSHPYYHSLVHAVGLAHAPLWEARPRRAVRTTTTGVAWPWKLMGGGVAALLLAAGFRRIFSKKS